MSNPLWFEDIFSQASAPPNPSAAAARIYYLEDNTFHIIDHTGADLIPSGSGSVTSVSFPTTPSWLSASVANPSSTPAITLSPAAGQTANFVLAAPDGVAGVLSPRLLVGPDVPEIDLSASGRGGVSLPITGTPTLGSVPIGQGDGTAAFGDPFVQGVYDPGTNCTTGGISGGPIKPVLIGGKGASDSLLYDISVDSSGRLNVNINGTVPISGTIAVTQSTSPWVVSDTNLELAQASTTSGQVGPLVQAACNTAAPTYVDGKTYPLTMNTSGGLRVAVINTPIAITAASLPLPTNAAQETGGNLAAIKTDADTLAGGVSGGKYQENVAQIAGTATSVNNGTVDAGTQRVTIASDSTGRVSTKTALTAASPTAASVGTSSGAAVSSNANRKGLVLINTSANTISIAFGTAAVLNSGITLAPFGVFYMDEYSFTTAAVNAIASAVSSNLAVQEFS